MRDEGRARTSGGAPPAGSPPLYGDEPPLPGWDGLGAREAMRRLLDLPPEGLRLLRSYEARHRRRTQVLDAIRRALERRSARD